MYDLGNTARSIQHVEHYSLTIRSIAYQQFIYQHKLSFAHIARQYLYFSYLPENNPIKEIFLENTGITINKFLELLVIFTAYLANRDMHIIKTETFQHIYTKHKKTEIELFLDLFTKSNGEIRSYLSNFNEGKRCSDEFYEPTCYLAHPLIKSGSNYVVIDKQILWRSAENFIYDFMKRLDAQKFMNEFGCIFEKGIEKSIINSRSEYLTEKKIESIIKKGKRVDFLISEPSSNIFIEAKSVELAYQGKIAHSISAVEQKSGKIIEAINQAYSLSSNMELSENKISIKVKPTNYLIVVTYKDFYLGSGKNFYDGIAKTAIDSIIQSYTKVHIPIENIYFLTVGEFDLLCEAIRSKKTTFTDAIENAKAADSAPQTRKFNFSLHLASFGKLDNPKFLADILFTELDTINENYK